MFTNESFRLDGRVALVTGGAHSIGFALGVGLARAGAAVCFNCSNEASRQRGVEAYAKEGVAVHGYVADVTDEKAVQDLVARIEQEVGVIDILVNNAGIAQQKLLTDITDDDWRRMLDVNLSGAFYVTRAVLSGMIGRKSGSIVNVSSIWGQVGASCEAHYPPPRRG